MEKNPKFNNRKTYNKIVALGTPRKKINKRGTTFIPDSRVDCLKSWFDVNFVFLTTLFFFYICFLGTDLI